MLAIIKCFEEWKPELLTQEFDFSIQMLTDHKALKYFMFIKQLIKKQIKWAEILFEYDFKITYRPKTQNVKVDLLTRQAKKKRFRKQR